MKLKDIKLAIDTPYALRELVDWLRRELTIKDANDFTDMWLDYEVDEEIVSRAEPLLTDARILELAKDNLNSDQVLELAEDNLFEDQIWKLAQSKLSDQSLIEAVGDWDSEQVLGLAKTNLDDTQVVELVQHAIDTGFDKEALEELRTLINEN